MKSLIVIILTFFAAILVYVYNLPPKSPSIKDLHRTVTPNIRPEEPSARDTTLIDSIEADSDDKVQVYYYIIVGSFKTLTMAQQKAENLRKDIDANFIVIPPTTEGYCRISYGKYSTLEEAKFAIKSIGKNICPDAWILSVKE